MSESVPEWAMEAARRVIAEIDRVFPPYDRDGEEVIVAHYARLILGEYGYDKDETP